jgi:hypothetical protein
MYEVPEVQGKGSSMNAVRRNHAMLINVSETRCQTRTTIFCLSKAHKGYVFFAFQLLLLSP